MGTLISEKIDIMLRPKGTAKGWLPMGVPVASREDALEQIAKRSTQMDECYDFAIRVTTLEAYDGP